MTPVFDAYALVDRGPDGLSLCVTERRDGGLVRTLAAEPETRADAMTVLADALSDLVARDRVALVGFRGEVPVFQELSTHPWLDGRVAIWPFEADPERFDPPGPDGWRVLLAPVHTPGAVEDVARHLAKADGEGRVRAALHDRPAVPWSDAPVRFDYVRDPAAIYDASFRTIRDETDISRFPGLMETVAERLIHTCGETGIVDHLRFSEGAAEAGHAALESGAPILVDVEMLAHGITRSRLPADNAVICRLNDAGVAERAKAAGSTRAAAAVEAWPGDLDGAVVAIGNAPTALFRLLELLAAGAPRPALIVGMPVGFVGAVESKEALTAHADGIPFVTLAGRRGGSALAAACVNAITGGLP